MGGVRMMMVICLSVTIWIFALASTAGKPWLLLHSSRKIENSHDDEYDQHVVQNVLSGLWETAQSRHTSNDDGDDQKTRNTMRYFDLYDECDDDDDCEDTNKLKTALIVNRC